MSKFLLSIKSEISKKEKEVKRLNEDKVMYEELIKQISRNINKAENEIASLKVKYTTFESENFITDHAILRYLERAGLIDVDKIRELLLTPEVLLAVYNGVDKIKINGFDFRLKNGKIITIINEMGEKE